MFMILFSKFVLSKTTSHGFDVFNQIKSISSQLYSTHLKMNFYYYRIYKKYFYYRIITLVCIGLKRDLNVLNFFII